jgi:hypothetical protein
MIEYNNKMLEGAKINKVRKMTLGELDAHGWDDNRGFKPVYIIELDNGMFLYPSRDFEGNGGGVLFGVTKNEESFNVCERETPKHGEEIEVVNTSKMDNMEFGEYIRNCHKQNK